MNRRLRTGGFYMQQLILPRHIHSFYDFCSALWLKRHSFILSFYASSAMTGETLPLIHVYRPYIAALLDFAQSKKCFDQLVGQSVNQSVNHVACSIRS